MFVVFGMFLLIFVSGVVSSKTESLSVGDYDLEFSYDNVKAGERFNLEVSLTNYDNVDKENVVFEIDFPKDLDDINGDRWEVVAISSGETLTHIFRVEVDSDADSGVEDIEFELRDSFDDYDDKFEIEVKGDKAELEIFDIKANPGNIVPGLNSVELKLFLENKGYVDLESVKTELILPEGFTKSESFSDKENLGVLKEGEIKEVSFVFDVSEEVVFRDYVAQLKVFYEESSEKDEVLLDVEIPINSAPQFEIFSVESERGEIIRGKKATVFVKVRNYGSEDAEQTSVKVFEKSDQPFDFVEKTSEVGLLESGEYGVAIFEFDVDKKAKATKYIVDLQIRSINKGDVLTFDKSISLDVSNPEGVGAIFYVLIGFVLIGIFGVGFWVKRKRK